jgi:hypothetical protein
MDASTLQSQLQQTGIKTQPVGRIMEAPISPVHHGQVLPITESTPEISIPQELVDIVKKGHDVEVPLSPDVQQLGVTSANAAVPVKPMLPENINIPMSYEEATLKKKSSKISDALKWFADLVIYQWKKLKPDLYK